MRIKGLNDDLIKQYITESLLILMESRKYEKITITEITNKAGVNRSSYYRHFETKEDIIRFYLMSIMHEYMDKYRQNGSPDFASYILQMFRTFAEHRKDLMLIHHNSLTYLFLDVLNTCFHFDDITLSTRDKQYEAAYHIGGIYNDMLLWMNHEMTETPEQMTASVLSFHPKGTFTLAAL